MQNQAAFFDVGPIKSYHTWKQKRKFLSLNLPKYLLQFNEQNLIQWFSGHEKLALSNIQNENPNNVLSSLLIISILHFFKRNIQIIDSFKDFIYKSLNNSDMNIVCAAAKTLKWFAEESSTDYLISFKTPLEIASEILFNKRDQFYTNSLCILKTAGKFCPIEVFQIVLQRIPEIWNSLLSDDANLRSFAAKVLFIYINNLPDACNNYLAQFRFDWRTVMLGNNINAKFGAINFMHMLLPLYSDQLISSKLLSTCIDDKVNGNSDLWEKIFLFLIDLIQIIPETLNLQKAQDLLEKIFYVLEHYRNSPSLLQTAWNLVQKIISFGFFSDEIISMPILMFLSSIEGFINQANNLFKHSQEKPKRNIKLDHQQFYLSNHKIIDNDSINTNESNLAYYNQIAFTVFRKIIVRYSKYAEPLIKETTIFDSSINKAYLKAIKYCPEQIKKNSERILQLYKLGLDSKAQEFQVILSLEIIHNLKYYLWPNNDEQLDFVKNHMNNSSEKIRGVVCKCFKVFSCHEAIVNLLKMTVFDSSKKIRIIGISQITKIHEKGEFIDRRLTKLLLTDSSYKVRRLSFKLNIDLAKEDPFTAIPEILNYFRDFIYHDASPIDPVRSLKACSFLVTAAEVFSKEYLPEIVHLCCVLLRNKSSSDSITRDFSVEDGLSFSPEEQPTLYSIWKLSTSQYSIRKTYLLLTALSKMKENILPFIDEVVPTCIEIFEETFPDETYLAALKIIRTITENSQCKLNLISLFPSLMNALLSLLKRDCGENVAISTLKLTGLMGATEFPSERLGEERRFRSVIVPNYTKFVLDCLLSPKLSPYSTQIFKAIAVVIAENPINGNTYVPKVISLIIAAFQRIPNEKNALFESIELIALKSSNSLTEFLTQLTPIFLENMNNIACVKLCSTLSMQLRDNFIHSASLLFPLCLREISLKTPNDKYFYRFIALSICYQGQSFELFLEVIERIMLQPNWSPPKPLLTNLLRIIQFGGFEMFSARIIKIVFCFSKYEDSKDWIEQIVLAIALNNTVDFTILQSFFEPTLQKALSRVEHILQNQRTYLMGNISFVKTLNLKAFSSHLEKILNDETSHKGFPTNSRPFSNLPKPDYVNLSSWLDEIIKRVFSLSPVKAITACSQIAAQNPTFRDEVFPIAFLASYSDGNEFERQNVSDGFSRIFENLTPIDPRFLEIVEMLERAGCPLYCNCKFVAKSCTSPALSCYFLRRHLQLYPNDEDAIDQLLNINSQMGRLESARGLLSSALDHLSPEKVGGWSEKLGEWSRALEIYEKSDGQSETTDQSALIRCYAHLQQWDKIREIANAYDNNSTNISQGKIRSTDYQIKIEESESNDALWFAWAFYHSHEFDRVSQYIEQLDKSFDSFLFISLFQIASGKFDAAEKSIETAYTKISSNRRTFDGSDADAATKLLINAQLLIELEEALKAKKNSTNVSETWNNRLNRFHYGSDAWMKLIEIRSLVNHDQNSFSQKDTILTIIKALRKEQSWKMIHTYFDVFFADEENSKDPKVQISHAKLLWECGNHQQAIKLLSSYESVEDNTTKAKMIRLKASYQFLLPNFSMKQILDLYKESLKLNPNDAKAWSEYAYMNARFLGVGLQLSNKIINNRSQTQIPITSSPLQVNKKAHEESENENKIILKKILDNEDEYIPQPDITINDIFNEEEIGDYEEDELDIKEEENEYEESIEENEALKMYHQAFTEIIEQNNEEGSKDKKVPKKLQHEKVNQKQLRDEKLRQQRCIYAKQAVMAFLKATQLQTDSSLEYLCQICSVIFSYGDELNLDSNFTSEIESLPIDAIEQIIPQLVTQITHPSKSTRNIAITLIKHFGNYHFESIFYPLHLIRVSNDKEKAQAASDLLKYLANANPQKSIDANIFVDGMFRAAISWFESWKNTCGQALWTISNGKVDAAINLIKAQIQETSEPKSAFDRSFLRSFHEQVLFIQNLISSSSNYSIPKLRQAINNLFANLVNKVGHLEQIQLIKVSESLFAKRHFAICVPGVRDNSRIDYVDHTLQVLKTQQHPRSIYIYDEKGNSHRFLLKGNQDLRLDQRIMQFFHLVNLLIKSKSFSHKTNGSVSSLQICKYAIIPFAPKVGLIGWVGGTDTLHDIVVQIRQWRHKISKTCELDIIKTTTCNYSSLNRLQKKEIFNILQDATGGDELREMLWLRSPTPTAWIRKVDEFTQSTATMSIAGYIVGLGDRHPSNIMINRETGHVVHIDFGDSFELALLRKQYPEKVPFRLTRMIVNALDCGGIDGLYRSTAINILGLLRRHFNSLVTQLEIFVHEPIFLNNEEQERMKMGMLDRIALKLKGLDPDHNPPDVVLSPKQQADALINTAANPENYMQHYVGWCPFW